MENNAKIGKIGEDIACEYLINKQWKIINRNYRRKSDEIDIIARSTDGILVFCEVKSLIARNRENERIDFLKPEDNMTSNKLRKITRACEFFVRQNPEMINEERGWRIDLLAIDIGTEGKMLNIRHYTNL